MDLLRKNGGKGPVCAAFGIGDAGCNVIGRLAERCPEGLELTAVNTDERGLPTHARIDSIRIGTSITRGCGAGGNPLLAKRAAEMDFLSLKTRVQGKNLLFFVAGLGGGTGSGVTPMLLQEARKNGVFSMVFAVLPLAAEGKKRREQAERAAASIKEASDVMVCFPNQHLPELSGEDAPLPTAFATANDMLATSLSAIWRAITDRGAINLDFSDFRSFMEYAKNGCVFATLRAAGPAAVENILAGVRANPLLLRGTALAQASAVLVSTIAGRDFSLREMNSLMAGIADMCPPGVTSFCGVICDPARTNELDVTILACERKLQIKDEIAAPEKKERGKPADNRPLITTARPIGEEARGKLTQPGLFEDAPAGQGRFKNTAPTIHGGDNLDIPTFIRKGVVISKKQGIPSN